MPAQTPTGIAMRKNEIEGPLEFELRGRVVEVAE
jgi:hypothetical protein